MVIHDIRWRIGLWRIWIVLTCAWVIAAYVIVGPIERIERRSDPIRLSVGMAYEQVEFPAGTEREIMRRAISRLVKSENDKANRESKNDPFQKLGILLQRDPEKEADEALEFYSPPESIAHIVVEFILTASLPPLLVLGLASLLVWVGRGFAPNKL